jgi:4-hydroxybenzoate polyprenyltransferase
VAGYILSVLRQLLGTLAVFVGVMTPVIFITIGFLSCWFLLYALVEWTQDRRGKPEKGRNNSGIHYSSQGSERVIDFRNKEMLDAKKRL